MVEQRLDWWVCICADAIARTRPGADRHSECIGWVEASLPIEPQRALWRVPDELRARGGPPATCYLPGIATREAAEWPGPGSIRKCRRARRPARPCGQVGQELGARRLGAPTSTRHTPRRKR